MRHGWGQGPGDQRHFPQLIRQQPAATDPTLCMVEQEGELSPLLLVIQVLHSSSDDLKGILGPRVLALVGVHHQRHLAHSRHSGHDGQADVE